MLYVWTKTLPLVIFQSQLVLQNNYVFFLELNFICKFHKTCTLNSLKIGRLINLIAVNKILQLCFPKRKYKQTIARK
jgi:hypothetical protein